MILEFKNGILETNDVELNSFLLFNSMNEEYETNRKFLDSFPNKPYKSLRRKVKYVTEILMKMNDNGIKITNNG